MGKKRIIKYNIERKFRSVSCNIDLIQYTLVQLLIKYQYLFNDSCKNEKKTGRSNKIIDIFRIRSETTYSILSFDYINSSTYNHIRIQLQPHEKKTS